MEDKIRIRFELTDECGNNFVSESKVQVFTDLGETDIDVIGEQLNVFLKQCGYARKNDYILMKDLTEEEYYKLADYLEELRNGDDVNDD